MQRAKGLTLLPQAAIEVPGEYLSCRGFPDKYGVLSPSQAPQPRAPEPGRAAHITSGCERQRGFCLPGRGRIQANFVTWLLDRGNFFLTRPTGAEPSFTGPNLGLFRPDKLCWPHPDDSLRPCPPQRCASTQQEQLDLVYPGTFAECSPTQLWHRDWTHVDMENTSHLVTH